MKFRIVLAIALSVVGPVASGQSAVAVYHGEHDNYARTAVSVRFGPVWEQDWGHWRARLHPEADVGHFRYTGSSDGADAMSQLGATALLRVVRGIGTIRPYAELGLGGALLSRTSLGPKRFSTNFQFAEHVGLGAEFGGFSAGWRYSHFSNADIETPNEGIDLHQIVIGARF
jgi:opacity protein-like surface antigen